MSIALSLFYFPLQFTSNDILLCNKENKHPCIYVVAVQSLRTEQEENAAGAFIYGILGINWSACK